MSGVFLFRFYARQTAMVGAMAGEATHIVVTVHSVRQYNASRNGQAERKEARTDSYKWPSNALQIKVLVK